MQLVIADTGPINYLVLIRSIDLLPILFDSVILPSAVQSELADSSAPPAVQHWITNRPIWIEIHEAHGLNLALPIRLDRGETAAIELATSLGADLVLMDERKGVKVAKQ
jgi:predicted nucleic acid-binding protein